MMEPQDTPESVNVTATCQPADTRGAHADSPNVPRDIDSVALAVAREIVGFSVADLQLVQRKARIQCIVADAIRTAAPQWQPIETAPRDGTPILTFRPDTHGHGFSPITGIDVLWWDADCWFYAGEPIVADFPTHWQPLPSPPVASDGSRKE